MVVKRLLTLAVAACFCPILKGNGLQAIWPISLQVIKPLQVGEDIELLGTLFISEGASQGLKDDGLTTIHSFDEVRPILANIARQLNWQISTLLPSLVVLSPSRLLATASSGRLYLLYNKSDWTIDFAGAAFVPEVEAIKRELQEPFLSEGPGAFTSRGDGRPQLPIDSESIESRYDACMDAKWLPKISLPAVWKGRSESREGCAYYNIWGVKTTNGVINQLNLSCSDNGSIVGTFQCSENFCNRGDLSICIDKAGTLRMKNRRTANHIVLSPFDGSSTL